MQTPNSGYVTLQVRERRYLGTWSALQNIIRPTQLLQSINVEFSIRVNHLMWNDKPNNFPAVTFTRLMRFRIIDTKLGISTKPIRLYQVKQTEFSQDHLEVLHLALVDHGCCREQVKITSEPNLYRIKD